MQQATTESTLYLPLSCGYRRGSVKLVRTELGRIRVEGLAEVKTGSWQYVPSEHLPYGPVQQTPTALPSAINAY
jgi:hypothetical protein